MSQLTTSTDGNGSPTEGDVATVQEIGDVKVMRKSLYSISILDNIDTLTLDHLVVPPACTAS